MEKKGKEQLTNEELRGKFKNNFDLVNYAILLAENMIKSGRDSRVKSDMQNRAMLILEEIREGKDQFDEIRTNHSVVETSLQDFITPKLVEERAERKKAHLFETFNDDDE